MTNTYLAEAGLPQGVTLATVAGVLIPIAVITVLLRWIPFGAAKALKGSSLLSLLAVTMPVGVMTVLVVYTLKDVSANSGGWGAALIGIAATVLLHWWRKDAALSIIGGTLIYMLLVNVVF